MYGLVINTSKKRFHIIPEEWVDEMKRRKTIRYVRPKDVEKVLQLLE